MFEAIRQQFFPTELIHGICAKPEYDAEQFWSIVHPLLVTVFPPFTDIGAYETPPERRRRSTALQEIFAQTHREYLMLYAGDEPIGWTYGEMRDTETFFMTNTAILSAYRGRGIYTALVKQLLAYLATLGYERVVSNHQTNNRAIIIAKLKLGFNVTAVNLDERWGAQVEMTYLFHPDRRLGYERAFALELRDTPVSHQ